MKKYLNGKLVELTPDEISAREARVAAWESRVPNEVSPYQARVALKRAGLLGQVEALMNDPKTDEEAKIAWEFATVIRRDSPFIAAFAPALGLTDEQIDNLFRAAANVK